MRSVLGLGLVVILSIAVFLFASLAFAQGGATGAITGTVQDPTASVLAGAGVKIISDATGAAVRQLTTDSSGAFTATLLPVGSYSVEVSAAGFATTKFSGIAVLWETSPVVTLQSGTPFTIWDPAGGTAYNLASPCSTAEFSPGFSCSNALSRGSITSRVANWVNPAAYSPDPGAPAAGGGFTDATVYGNTPRNCIIGPHQRNMDLTMGKTLKITEQQNLRFRADFFNLFNHPSFANPSVFNGGGAVGFAPITQVIGTPRLIQFSLKYSF
jgi:hypothetical protein